MHRPLPSARAQECFSFLLLMLLTSSPSSLFAASPSTDIQVIPQCPSAECRLVFIHVPKTGGSTFIQAMVAYAARHDLHFIRCMTQVSQSTCKGWTASSTLSNTLQDTPQQQHANAQGMAATSSLVYREVPANISAARVIFGHMPLAPWPVSSITPDSKMQAPAVSSSSSVSLPVLLSSSSAKRASLVRTLYITVLREPIARIISHYNYEMPNLSFETWYRTHVQHTACNLQVAYLAGVAQSGPLSSANKKCHRIQEAHLHTAVCSLRQNITLLGLHDYHLHFDKQFLCMFPAMDALAAEMILAHHAQPHEHRGGNHATHFTPITLNDISEYLIEQMYEDNLLDVLLYLSAAKQLNRVSSLGRAAKSSVTLDSTDMKHRNWNNHIPYGFQHEACTFAERVASSISVPSSFSVLQPLEKDATVQERLLYRLYSNALNSELLHRIPGVD
eukprot:m.133942 g.133942  ORF g.133942 m.133942 type:complete len:447 (-) comp15812_c0_seq3:269-1609(-)